MHNMNTSWVENFRYFSCKEFFTEEKKINSNFSHIFIARHIVNLQEWIAHSRSVVHICMATFFLVVMCALFSANNREFLSSSSHLPPTGSLSSILIITADSTLVFIFENVEEENENSIFYDFWSGLERCLEASASLLIEILTVNFRLSIDHRRFRGFRASPLSGPKRTIEVVKIFCFSLYINCYY